MCFDPMFYGFEISVSQSLPHIREIGSVGPQSGVFEFDIGYPPSEFAVHFFEKLLALFWGIMRVFIFVERQVRSDNVADGFVEIFEIIGIEVCAYFSQQLMGQGL